MGNKKFKEVQKLDEKARAEKLKELKLELTKKGINANKAAKGKMKEIKKAIARILTLNTVQTKDSEDKK